MTRQMGVSIFDCAACRRGFHSGAVPVFVGGIGGPGAPHEFTFERRDNENLVGQCIENRFWGYDTHPRDVVLRSGHGR